MTGVRWLCELIWSEAKEALKNAHFSVLPCGSLEQHGLHLPLATDSMIATGLLKQVAERLGGELTLLVLPMLSYGHSPEHLGFPGTVSLPRDVLSCQVVAIAQSLARHGAKRLLLLNSHGGNRAVLAASLMTMREKTGLVPYLFDIYESNTIRRHASQFDIHAGAVETSLMLAISPQTVRKDAYSESRDSSVRDTADLRLHRPWRSEEFSRTGVIGSPQTANALEGQQMLAELADELVRLLIASSGPGDDIL